METLPMVCVLLRIQPRLNNEANNLSKLVKLLPFEGAPRACQILLRLRYDNAYLSL